MYWERYIDRRNPRRIEPLDKPIDTYIMLDTETTGLHPEEGATLIEIGALFVQPGNENSRPKFEQLIDPQHPLTEFITGLTGITDRMLQGMPTAGAAMMRFHQWIDHVWPAGEPLTIIASRTSSSTTTSETSRNTAHCPTRSRSRCSTKRFALRPPGEGSGMKGKTDMVASSGRRRVEMSIVTDEAEDYANSQDYDCCQIIEGAFTVGDAIIEAYAAGRLASSTDAGVEAAADFFTSHLSMLGSASSFIDTGRAKDLARGMLDAARKAINRPATSQIQRTSMGLSGHMEYRHTMK